MRRETGLSPPVKYFYWPFQGGTFLWIIYVISVLFLLCFRARLFIDVLWSPAGKWLFSWLKFVISNCEVVFLPFVSCVRCLCLIVSISDICPFLTFYFHKFSNGMNGSFCCSSDQLIHYKCTLRMVSIFNIDTFFISFIIPDNESIDSLWIYCSFWHNLPCIWICKGHPKYISTIKTCQSNRTIKGLCVCKL